VFVRITVYYLAPGHYLAKLQDPKVKKTFILQLKNMFQALT